ncbi:hypothetical protein PRJ39_06235 [Lysobacter enzymogenes]|uniref:hypothetical protein n=1 Tax=Lysobacter enzymogenes TaxID=69 RepID=UPI00374A56CB
MQEHIEHLKDYLRGMKRGDNRKALSQLTAISDWPNASQQELERRASATLQILPDEILVAIANGEIDVREAIADVLAE